MAQDIQQESNWKFLSTLLRVYNGLLMFAGIGGLFVGMWMCTDQTIYEYLHVIRRTPDDSSMIAAIAIIISIVVSWFACFALANCARCYMVCYILLILLIMLLELTAGFIVVAFKHDINRDMTFAKESMRAMLTDHYEWDNEYGIVWNKVQVRGTDLEVSQAINVPDSCCKLEPNQDRDVGRVDPQNPHPKDRQKCNEDSAGKRDGSEYLNGRGCSAAFFRDLIEDLMTLLIVLGLWVGYLQLFGLVGAALQCYFLRRRKEMV